MMMERDSRDVEMKMMRRRRRHLLLGMENETIE